MTTGTGTGTGTVPILYEFTSKLVLTVVNMYSGKKAEMLRCGQCIPQYYPPDL